MPTPELPTHIIQALLDLAEGRTEPEDWLVWWNAHIDEIEKSVPRGWFLRLKPATGHGGGIHRTVAVSQGGARYVLEALTIPCTWSDRYVAAAKQDFQRSCDEQDALRKAKGKEYEPIIKEVARHFPKFARFLKANVESVNQLAPGSEGEDTALPAAYRKFLRSTREIVVGDTLQMTTIHPFPHPFGKGLLCIAEYWLDGDGDQALLDLRDPGAADDPPVLYYAHDAPGVRPLAASFTKWIESLPRTLKR
jgi:hypothetical protein